MPQARARRQPPRIESLKVTNFRALRDVELTDLTPMTVLLGPNGSGKSTVFDVLQFLSDCFQLGLRQAWDRRGRAAELKTRSSSGPVIIEIRYRERRKAPIITYHLAIDEESPGRPIIEREWLQWRRGKWGKPFRFLDYTRGQGEAISGESPERDDKRVSIPLKDSQVMAVATLGQFADHPRVSALRDFITDWHVSYLTIEDTRRQPETGPQESLSRTGDNLANVIQFLGEQHPERLDEIFRKLSLRVPRLERVLAEPQRSGHLLLLLKDAPFDQPVLSRFVSDGTLKMLAYLVLLMDPTPPQFIGIEEPENLLHPRLLPELAEECREAAERSQLLVTTHSPFFLNSIRPEEARVLWRDASGFTQARRVSQIRGIKELMAEGAVLGDLWLEGHLGVGDPFAPGATATLLR